MRVHFADNTLPRPVTRAYLDELKRSANVPNSRLEYTIGGMRETIVHSSVEADRQFQLMSGERLFLKASQELQKQYAFKSINGHARGQFQSVNRAPEKSQQKIPANQNTQQNPKDEKPQSMSDHFREQGKELMDRVIENQRSHSQERERSR